MSSDKPATYQTTTSSTAPWSGQQEYLKTGYERAQTDVLDKPTEFYPNSTVVPFAPQTEQALGLQEQRALAGSPVTKAAQEQVRGTTAGDYLTAGNPYMQQAIKNVTDPIGEQFQEDIIPGIQSGFSGAGRYGAGLQARAQERAGQAAMREIGNIGTQMGKDIYEGERARQMQAASLAPQMAQQDYTDIQALRGVGDIREAQAGAELQGDIARFQHGQQAPKDALAQYMALVGGGGYTDTSETSPIYRNKMADALGMGSTAAGIAGTLFGKQGIWG